LWKPSNESNSERRLLWIWTHPLIYNQIKLEFIKIFEIENNKEENSPEPPENKKAKIETEIINDLIFKNDFVTLKCLKDKLVRFKLLGPLATTILSFALKIEDFSKLNLQTIQKWTNNDELSKYILFSSLSNYFQLNF
jgi:hypothetical protein